MVKDQAASGNLRTRFPQAALTPGLGFTWNFHVRDQARGGGEGSGPADEEVTDEEYARALSYYEERLGALRVKVMLCREGKCDKAQVEELKKEVESHELYTRVLRQ